VARPDLFTAPLCRTVLRELHYDGDGLHDATMQLLLRAQDVLWRLRRLRPVPELTKTKEDVVETYVPSVDPARNPYVASRTSFT